MTAGIDPVARDIATALGASTVPDSLRPISRDPAIAVADATLAYLIDGKTTRDSAVLLVSNAAFPNAVADAATRARHLRKHLDAATAHHILMPHESGTHRGQTWGLYPRLEPYSANRALRMVQKKIFIPRLEHWLTDVARQTQRPVDATTLAARFAAPLERMAADTDLPERVRASATAYGTRLTEHPVRLVAEHGDFWIGNVMFSRGTLPGLAQDFFAIDWGGARLDGYPCMDLLRYMMSAYRTGSAAPTGALRTYLKALDMPEHHGALYALASLGHLGQTLDQFPKARYVELTCTIHDYLHSANLL